MNIEIGEFIAMFVAAHAILFANTYLGKKGYGNAAVILILIVISFSTYILIFAAYVILITNSTLILDNTRLLIFNAISLGGGGFILERAYDRIRRD